MSDKPMTFEEWRDSLEPGPLRARLLAMEDGPVIWQARDAEMRLERAANERLRIEIAELKASQQRQMDLLRYARHFLRDGGCISDDEYAALVQDCDGRVEGLESYDKKVDELKAQTAAMLEEAATITTCFMCRSDAWKPQQLYEAICALIPADYAAALRKYGLRERLDQAKKSNCSNSKCESCEYEQNARKEEITNLERQLAEIERKVME